MPLLPPTTFRITSITEREIQAFGGDPTLCITELVLTAENNDALAFPPLYGEMHLKLSGPAAQYGVRLGQVWRSAFAETEPRPRQPWPDEWPSLYAATGYAAPAAVTRPLPHAVGE